jgi:hypothetical protein
MDGEIGSIKCDRFTEIRTMISTSRDITGRLGPELVPS